MSDTDHELERIKLRKMAQMMKEESNTPALTTPVHLTEATFDEFIENSPIVLVDFWAEWCGPCKMVGPILDDLAQQYSGTVWIGKIDVDTEKMLAMKYGANSIPTFWAFKEGIPVGRFVGAQPRAAFENVIKQLIELDMEEIRRKQQETE